MGPLTQAKPWSMDGVEGVFRFLNRMWRLIVDDESGGLVQEIVEAPADAEQLRALHGLIKKVTDDIEALSFNTAIAAMMTFLNEAAKWERRPKAVMESVVLLLAPFAPHAAEELWARLGHDQTLAREPWPAYDPARLVQDAFEYGVQVNGKVRSRFTASAKAPAAELEQTALADPVIQKWIAGKTIKKVIVVPGRLVNLIVAG